MPIKSRSQGTLLRSKFDINISMLPFIESLFEPFADAVNVLLTRLVILPANVSFFFLFAHAYWHGRDSPRMLQSIFVSLIFFEENFFTPSDRVGIT